MTDEEIDALTSRISNEIINSGFAFIVTTTLLGKKTLRMCTVNANTTEDDIRKTIELLDEIAEREVEKIRSSENQYEPEDDNDFSLHNSKV